MIMKTILLFFIAVMAWMLQGGAQTVTDADGNVYQIVVINHQQWMKENLKVTHYNNGVLIPNITDARDWKALRSGARCYYDNDSIANDSIYGALYNWYVVKDNLICPSGWHIPTHAEWTALEDFLGGWEFAGGKMKEQGTLHWKAPNNGATNSSGFTGLPGGMRGLENRYEYKGENGLWWTSSLQSSLGAWSRYLWYMADVSDANPVPKTLGLSLRCICDALVGLNEADELPGIKMYPNPAKSILRVDLGNQPTGLFSVYNVSGVLVMQINLTQSVSEIPIHHLSKGLYVVKIASERQSVQSKVLVEE